MPYFYTDKSGCDKLKMMKSVIKKFAYSNSSDIQKVQLIRWDNWDELFFLHPLFAGRDGVKGGE